MVDKNYGRCASNKSCVRCWRNRQKHGRKGKGRSKTSDGTPHDFGTTGGKEDQTRKRRITYNRRSSPLQEAEDSFEWAELKPPNMDEVHKALDRFTLKQIKQRYGIAPYTIRKWLRAENQAGTPSRKRPKYVGRGGKRWFT